MFNTPFNRSTVRGVRGSSAISAVLLVLALVAGAGQSAKADAITGTVSFEGQVFFAAPIAGISEEDLDVSVRLSTEATGPGEKCKILSITTDNPDPNGLYPSGGVVDAEIEISRGGQGKLPEEDCIITVQAAGTDGVSVSARGSETIFVNAAEIGASATVGVPDITVRESKAVAGLEKDCRRWFQRQLRKRGRCNFVLLKKGSIVARRCRSAGEEPAGCDPGDHTEAILALSWGVNDQQAGDPNYAENIDLALLKPQLICQKHFWKAAINFAMKRARLIQRKCIQTNLDSWQCREDRSADSKAKLDKIDKCEVDQLIDGATGRPVPDVGPPCDPCIDGAGAIDRKCLKGCFELIVGELTDGLIGDLPVCGNDILQPGEYCDDGNLVDGDCCHSDCTAEHLGDQTCGVGACEVTVPVCQGGEPVTCEPGTPGTEGPSGDPSCSDGVDNDCDGDTDAADTDCQ